MYPIYPYYSKKQKLETQLIAFPPQTQEQQPGLEYLMDPRPISENENYLGSGKLLNKVAIITGGDSGIGKAVALAFAKEGANIVIVYLNEHKDAQATKERVEQIGQKCLTISTDLREEKASEKVVSKAMESFGNIDILVNNHAIQFVQKSILDITAKQLENTFHTNLFSFFHLTKAVLPHLKKGSSIINTASITAYEGHPELIDYSATKGAIVTFTRSLALSLVDKQIRVNATAPGPIWTPLIPATLSKEDVATYGVNTPMKRAGQPFELAPAYVYLASDDSGYVTGQVLHINGGSFISS
ncbi:SDR family oxidoreductase [Halalkalibacter urbisdiaboli]|uniref:SDR family oxidoreductase n=1 Tax=Halalkalibacter urbisdiaboli TaxID=1960589 RepID=UPI000B44686F|nr:SDR family oxidoreductase [Halalkalibacter urbisdiaboli]